MEWRNLTERDVCIYVPRDVMRMFHPAPLGPVKVELGEHIYELSLSPKGDDYPCKELSNTVTPRLDIWDCLLKDITAQASHCWKIGWAEQFKNWQRAVRAMLRWEGQMVKVYGTRGIDQAVNNQSVDDGEAG